MLILVIYDVSVSSSDGQKRLQQVAKKCEANGQRVQNSVFECNLDWSQFISLQRDLGKIIDEKLDSLRFYNLGVNYTNHVIHFGIKPSIPLDGDLIV